MVAVISRQQARAEGIRFYFTGLPCRHGHLAERYVSCARCVVCTNSDAAAQAKRTPEETRKRLTAWRRANRERTKELSKRWAKANPRRKKENLERWHAAHPEKRKGYNKKWREKNPGAASIYARTHQARKRQADGSHTIADIRRILVSQKNRCAFSKYKFIWCKPQFSKRNRARIDHIKPLSKGGSNYPNNLQALCHACNERKWNKDQIDFLRKYGGLL